MNKIIIIGNSGAARECYQLFQDCIWNSNTLRSNSQFKGFLSFKNYQGNLYDLQKFLIGDFDNYDIAPEDRFVIGIGEPKLRKQVYTEAKAKGAVFINLVSPWAYFPDASQIGEANIIKSGSSISTGVHVGDGNYLNGNVNLGHDVKIGDFNFIAASTTFLGGATLGNENFIAVQSIFLEHCKVGNHNHICPGSVIYKGCKDNCRMAGNPALKIS